jgi:hypothetical protein
MIPYCKKQVSFEDILDSCGDYKKNSVERV